MTTPDIAGLPVRAYAYKEKGDRAWTVALRMPEQGSGHWDVEPLVSGPEAADALERQAAQIESLRGALEVARHALVCTENLRCTDQSIEALAAKLVNGVPRDQLEFMTNFASELAVIDAALTGEDA